MDSGKLDQSLWNDIRAGSERAFSTLFFRYSELLLNYGSMIVKDRELIKDCIQELFLDVWRRRGALPELVNTRHYLLKAFRRLLLRRMQQDERRRYEYALEVALYDPSHEESITQAETASSQRQYFAEKVNALPNRQKEIVYLKYYEDLSYEEICEVMGIKHQAAWNLISRAVKTLRSLVADRQTLLLLLSLYVPIA